MRLHKWTQKLKRRRDRRAVAALQSTQAPTGPIQAHVEGQFVFLQMGDVTYRVPVWNLRATTEAIDTPVRIRIGASDVQFLLEQDSIDQVVVIPDAAYSRGEIVRGRESRNRHFVAVTP